MRTATWVAVIAAIIIALGAWYWWSQQETGSSVGLANPASVNCTQVLGGSLQIVDEANGQVGYCHLKDGRVCEEWALYRDQTCSSPQAATSYKDATYVIDGSPVTLINGSAEVPAAPGSASMVTTKIFGNELDADLNGDGRQDVAFILTQSNGGSGTFYYAVAAINTPQGYVGTDGYLLGDRISPQATTLSQNPNQKGVVVFNFADRAVGEPMTAQATVGKSVYLKVDPATFRWGIVSPVAP